MAVKTVREILLLSSDYLQKHEAPSPRLEAELLMTHALGLQRRLDLYMIHDRPLNENELEKIRGLIRRRTLGEPVQYICGSTEFFSLEIEVGPGVLIPRPETEVLVERALEKIREIEDASTLRLLDICTGSGCIPLALKSQVPEAEIVACDISEDALKYARSNSKKLELAIDIRQGDLFSALSAEEKFHVICANPPYIAHAEADEMSDEVKKFEPGLALFCDDEGLALIQRIVREAKSQLLPGGWILIEMGWKQGDAVRQLLEKNGYKNCDILKDYCERERIAIGQMPN